MPEALSSAPTLLRTLSRWAISTTSPTWGPGRPAGTATRLMPSRFDSHRMASGDCGGRRRRSAEPRVGRRRARRRTSPRPPAAHGSERGPTPGCRGRLGALGSRRARRRRGGACPVWFPRRCRSFSRRPSRTGRERRPGRARRWCPTSSRRARWAGRSSLAPPSFPSATVSSSGRSDGRWDIHRGWPGLLDRRGGPQRRSRRADWSRSVADRAGHVGLVDVRRPWRGRGGGDVGEDCLGVTMVASASRISWCTPTEAALDTVPGTPMTGL